MPPIKPFLRPAAVYGFHVVLASLAGTLPPFLFFVSLFASSPNASFADVLKPALISGAGCFVFLIFPFCLFVAAPLAILAHRIAGLTFVRTVLLALVLTAPGILFVDYTNYRSSGPDSGPPTEAYSLSHLARSLETMTDVFLLIVIPAASALCCAITLWNLRFRNGPRSDG